MAQTNTRLEQTAQLAFIAACVLLCGLAVLRFTSATTGISESDTAPPLVGRALDSSSPLVDGKQWTVLVIVSSKCRYCIESLPLYRRLAEDSARNPFRLVFAGAEPLDTITGFLVANGHPKPTILSLPPEIPVSVTPTLVLINSSGEITSAWLGRLTPKQEGSLFGVISGRVAP